MVVCTINPFNGQIIDAVACVIIPALDNWSKIERDVSELIEQDDYFFKNFESLRGKLTWYAGINSSYLSLFNSSYTDTQQE